MKIRQQLLDSVAPLRMITAAGQAPERFDPPATTADVRVKLTRVNSKLRARAKNLGERLHFKPKRAAAPLGVGWVTRRPQVTDI
jgi:hypothetical protein